MSRIVVVALFTSAQALLACTSSSGESDEGSTGGGDQADATATVTASSGDAGGADGGGAQAEGGASAVGSTGAGGMAAEVATVALPGGASGVGFDDMRYATELGLLLVPAAGTGLLHVIDPDSLEITSFDGFQSVDSVDAGAGRIFVLDRGGQELVVVDPADGARLGSVVVQAGDYVRFAAQTGEAWVSRPSRDEITIYDVGTDQPEESGAVEIPGGPEGLVLAPTLGRAYAHASGPSIVAIDVAAREVIGTWPMGCSGAHGIPVIDEARGLVFAGCSSSEVVVLDAATGEVKGRQQGAGGATLLAYSDNLGHFYLRGDSSGAVAILGVDASGSLSVLGHAAVAERGHAAAADDRGHAWACDREAGTVLRITDAFASSR